MDASPPGCSDDGRWHMAKDNVAGDVDVHYAQHEQFLVVALGYLQCVGCNEEASHSEPNQHTIETGLVDLLCMWYEGVGILTAHTLCIGRHSWCWAFRCHQTTNCRAAHLAQFSCQWPAYNGVNQSRLGHWSGILKSLLLRLYASPRFFFVEKRMKKRVAGYAD